MKKLTCHCNAIEIEINISGNLDKNGYESNLVSRKFVALLKNGMITYTKNLNENGKQSDFINELNDLINNYGEWDLVVWSIPWSGEGRTLDYGIDINNKFIINGGSEFYIPEGIYLKNNFTPILTQDFKPLSNSKF